MSYCLILTVNGIVGIIIFFLLWMKNLKFTEFKLLSKVKYQVSETDVNLSGIKAYVINYHNMMPLLLW